MSSGNRRGPMGEGPKTGRGLGYCTGSDSPGCMKVTYLESGRESRRGMGQQLGRGAGRDFRCRKNCRKTPYSESLRAFAADGAYPGYYRSTSSEGHERSKFNLLENQIKLLNQEIEALFEKFKSLELQKNRGNE